jgi:signal transduction histidine kinase
MMRETAEIQAIEAKEAVRVREQVLAVVSHDLRNPLGAVGLSATMLLETTADPRARKQLEIIRRSADRMEHMISELLDIASIQAGRLALDIQPEDAQALLAEIPELHGALAAERGIALRIETRVAGVVVLCDRERIAQVFANLVGNAIKFCREGDAITICADQRGDRVRYIVADTGPGIADADLEHIFKPYWSAQGPGRRGLGLGLHISKGIIEAHGGELWVESKLGVGSKFFLTLPVAPGR